MLQENQTIFAGGVIANQRLYDFGFTSNLVDSVRLAERAQGQDVNARRALVIVSVQRGYLNSLKRRRLVQIAEETVRERGLIAGQIETLYRQQLKSKLDFDLGPGGAGECRIIPDQKQERFEIEFCRLESGNGYGGTRRLRLGGPRHECHASPPAGILGRR